MPTLRVKSPKFESLSLRRFFPPTWVSEEYESRAYVIYCAESA